MRILLAIDSFKGCMTTTEVEDIFAQGLRAQGHTVTALPMSDGGDGMLLAFTTAVHATLIQTKVHDPLMREVTAMYGVTPDGTAIIETAQACGLALLSPDERNPLLASTYGVGELITAAFRQGCRRFIIGLGGSATSDAGRGMLQALAQAFTDESTIYSLPDSPIARCRFILASDVRNPLYGRDGAAFIYAPQKGATPSMVKELDERAIRFSETAAAVMGKDSSHIPGAGAAGGLGYAFLQFLNATVRSGADTLLDLYSIDTLLPSFDLIITGEGHADRQTLMGKLPERVLQRALSHSVPVWLVAGRVSDASHLHDAGYTLVSSLTPPDMSLADAIQPLQTQKNILQWIQEHF